MSQDPFGPRSVHLPSLLAPAVEQTQQVVETCRGWQEAFKASRPDARTILRMDTSPIFRLSGFMAQRYFAPKQDDEFAKVYSEESRALWAMAENADAGWRMIADAYNGGVSTWEWLDNLEVILKQLRSQLVRATAECPTPPVRPAPQSSGGGPLADYFRSVWAAEEEYLASRSLTFEHHGYSYWGTHEGRERLESIDEQYGVAHGTDPRVYSIAAFIAEDAAFESEMKRRGLKFPQGEAKRYAQGRAKQYATDYEARHFLGCNYLKVNINNDLEIDNVPKLWNYLRQAPDRMDAMRSIHWGHSSSHGLAHKIVARARAVAIRLGVDFPRKPDPFQRDLNEAECRCWLDLLKTRLKEIEGGVITEEARKVIEASWGEGTTPGRNLLASLAMKEGAASELANDWIHEPDLSGDTGRWEPMTEAIKIAAGRGYHVEIVRAQRGADEGRFPSRAVTGKGKTKREVRLMEFLEWVSEQPEIKRRKKSAET